jgi:DNA-directed RNA polymerase subunit RPC12/RpoP
MRRQGKTMRRGIVSLILTLLFLLGAASYSFSQWSFTCSRCGKEIVGKYWKSGGQTLCEECYEKTRPRCSGCGAVIDGKYWNCKGKTLCNDCYEKTAPRCAYCGRIPTGRYWNTDKGICCEQCYEQHGLRCSICGITIKGKYYTSPVTSRIACEECRQLYPTCRNCGGPAGPGSVTIETGFIVCPACSSRAIVKNSQILPIFKEARSIILLRLGLDACISGDHIILTDSRTLKSMSAKHAEYVPKKGIAGLHTMIDGVSYIYVLRGHSPEAALETTAHEYAHAWQALNCPPNQSLSFREGFAEWVSYKVLVYKGYMAYVDRKLKGNDSIYGEGLKKMLMLEKRLGPSNLIEYVKTHNNF